jgi:hypothetical protein
MGADFRSLLDELRIPSLADNLVDEDPPEPVDEAKLRAFYEGGLTGPEREWIAFLVTRYRVWHQADMRLGRDRVLLLTKANAEREDEQVVPLDPHRAWSRNKTWALAIGSLSIAAMFVAAGLIWITRRGVTRLDDGLAKLTIYKSGEVDGLSVYPASQKGALQELLVTQALPTPALFDELSKDIGERSTGGGPRKVLKSPVGTAVASRLPTFRWKELPNAVSYRVVVFDANGVEVLSGTSTEPSWTATRDLNAGQSYTWRIYATLKSGEKLSTPTSAEPKAKFKILDDAQRRQIEEAQQRFGRSDLYMVFLLTRYGILDAAEQHLERLVHANPDSDIAAGLMRAFRELRSKAP